MKHLKKMAGDRNIVNARNSVLLGGIDKTLAHFDAFMWKPTLSLDGEVALRDGVRLLTEAETVA